MQDIYHESVCSILHKVICWHKPNKGLLSIVDTKHGWESPLVPGGRCVMVHRPHHSWLHVHLANSQWPLHSCDHWGEPLPPIFAFLWRVFILALNQCCLIMHCVQLCCVALQLGAMDGMQGQPMMGKMKMFFRGFAILIVPLTASFPKVRLSEPCSNHVKSELSKTMTFWSGVINNAIQMSRFT